MIFFLNLSASYRNMLHKSIQVVEHHIKETAVSKKDVFEKCIFMLL